MEMENVKQYAALSAMTGLLGAAMGFTNVRNVHLWRGGAAYKFANTATHALRQHAGLSGAIGAGATAAVGGPAMAGFLVATAPFVAGAAVLGLATFGGYKLYEALREE